ncbi:MAG: hypothetical protein FJ319_06095 [SAR202 cluster bacterium]|nr:hypothetical protein [SAR202 cluster bacterium]
MDPILQLSIRQLSGKWRVTLIAVLAALPVALMLFIKLVAGEEIEFNADFINVTLSGMVIGAVLPIVLITLSTASLGNEVENRTLGFLITKPVPRYRIVLPKVLAAVVIGGSFIVASAVASTFIGGGSVQAAIAVAAGVAIGVIAYSTILTWAGLLTSRAIGFAIVYVLLWEGAISSFLGGARYVSVRAYVLSIMHELDKDSFAPLSDGVIEWPAAVVGAAAVIVVFFWLTVLRLRRMDVQ